MLVIFQQVFILFAFAVIGYILSRLHILDHNHSKTLSAMLVYIFLPCNIIKTFSTRCTVEYIKNGYGLLLAGVGIIVIVATAMYFVSKIFSKDKYIRAVYEYSLVIPNISYMGFSLAEALYGPDMLINIMMLAMPSLVYTYSIGFCKLTKRGLSFKKLFSSPSMISMLLGGAAGLASVPVNDTVMSLLGKAGGCMGPVSMILAGVVISQFPVKFLVNDIKTYIITALRLIIIPVTMGCILIFCGCSHIAVQAAVTLFAMPCGLNAIVFPNLVGEDCKTGAGLAFVSNILACITIPIVLSLFGVSV